MIREAVRQSIVAEVRALFNDANKNETPIARSPDAMIAPTSVVWRVHGDVTTMMVGGVAALLLEMLHPSALAGVWDHSNFRRDMLGRLRRTARFLAVTTYGPRADADAAIARVRRIHAAVAGTRPDGVAYVADDPHLLAWIHVAGAICFLDAWRRFGEPGMSAADQDAYFADVAPVARALGADPVPESRAQAEAIIATFRAELHADARSREIADIVLKAGRTSLKAAPVQGLVGKAAVDLLPTWARSMHGLRASVLARPAIDIATYGVASTLRWAFADGYRK
jgi:uncharacterized protein (DUF2236 family)